jgi:hypothetical protein
MTFLQRAIGAAKLNVPVFEEIEADRTATGQALLIVVLSTAAAGIGLTAGDAPVLHRVMLALFFWVFWAIATYIVGVYLMPEQQTETSVGELLRTIGFGASPGMLRIFGVVPVIGGTIYVISTAWMLVAIVVAIRQALDYKSTGRAVVVCIITGMIGVVMAALLGALLFMLFEEVVF